MSFISIFLNVLFSNQLRTLSFNKFKILVKDAKPESKVSLKVVD